MHLLPQFASQHNNIDHLLNTIHHADAMDLLARIPDNSIDMGMMSPPYDNLRTYNGFTFPFEAIAKELFRVLKNGGVCVWVVGDATINGSETLTSMRQALYFVDECGFKMHDTMIYQRNGRFPESNRYWQDFEYMFVLSKGKPVTFNPLQIKGNNTGQKIRTERQVDGTLKKPKTIRATNTMKNINNIWAIDSGFMKTTKDVIAFQHPAIFPEKLAHDHIYSWSNEGDIVLDIFMGSGTTAKMAKNLNRNYIGCDITQEYVDIANQRLQATDPYVATPLANGQTQLSLFQEQTA